MSLKFKLFLCFQVKYFKRGQARNSSNQVIRTKKHNTDIKALYPNTEYVFQVRAQTAQGSWSPFSMPAYATTTSGDDPVYGVVNGGPGGDEDGEGSDIQVRVAIGVIVAVVLIMGFTTAIWVWMKRNSQPGWTKQGGIPGEILLSNTFPVKWQRPYLVSATYFDNFDNVRFVLQVKKIAAIAWTTEDWTPTSRVAPRTSPSYRRTSTRWHRPTPATSRLMSTLIPTRTPTSPSDSLPKKLTRGKGTFFHFQQISSGK